ncbi:MAG: sigma-70 family RNA polymerase sigma factor [Anaerolineae bacterium]|nr:sigma-70 family RNA polymerase sigma factor [Phycisphaerae bacterium]
MYDELRAMARARLMQQRAGHTLQPTALANEAWMKLRGHFNMAEPTPAFFKTAAEAMRQILIDHARARQSLKRGGGAKREDGSSAIGDVADDSEPTDHDQILAMNDAIAELERLDAQAASVVKLRFFVGLSVEETATALGISDRTVKREWQFARTWLSEQMQESSTAM